MRMKEGAKISCTHALNIRFPEMNELNGLFYLTYDSQADNPLYGGMGS